MKPVTIFGVTYPSIKALQQDYPYISVTTLSIRINRGLTDAEVIAPASKSPILLTIGEDAYSSVADAARDTEVPYPTYLYRTKRAMNAAPGTGINLMKEYKPRSLRAQEQDAKRKAIVIEGVCYASYKDASIATGINYQTLISRIKNGWYNHPNGEMISPPKKKTRGPGWGDVITYQGVDYRSKVALAEAYGANPERFRVLLNKGFSIPDALERSALLVFRGEKYKNKTALANAFGVDPRRFLYRMNLGYSIEDSLSSASNAALREKYGRKTERGVCDPKVVAIGEGSNEFRYEIIDIDF